MIDPTTLTVDIATYSTLLGGVVGFLRVILRWHSLRRLKQLKREIRALEDRNVEDDHEALEVPNWGLKLMNPTDAQRYEYEWGAHLYQLIEEGEHRQARRDRRRLAWAAVFLAVALRVRRVLSRAR